MPGYLPYTLGYNPILPYLFSCSNCSSLDHFRWCPWPFDILPSMCVCVCVCFKFIYCLLNCWPSPVACEILSFLTRGWIHTLCTGRLCLNHWIATDVWVLFFWSHPCLLAFHGAPGSSCVLESACPTLESAFSLNSSSFFYERMVLESKVWVQDGSLLLGCYCFQFLSAHRARECMWTY